MLSPELYQSHHQKTLEAFLDQHHPDGNWSFGHCAGIIFAVQSAPEMVPPSDWLPVALDDAELQTESEAKRVIGALMALYNWVGERIAKHELPIPPGYEPRAPVLANFEDDNPFRQWSRGLRIGHDWLEALWIEHVPNHEEVASGLLMPAVFLEDIDMARDLYQRFFDQQRTFEEVANGLLTVLPQAIVEYAEAGRKAFQALVDHHQQPLKTSKVGRNEPCPCGSGKKYKKCCLGREQPSSAMTS